MTNYSTRLSAAFVTVLALCGMAPARAADACQDIERATSRIWEIPVHLYTSQTAAYRGNQIRNSESIYTGGADGTIYVMVNGKWTRSHITTRDLKAGKDDPGKKAKQTCRYERGEAVNGEPAAVYSTHAETEAGKTDMTVWISKAKNVPLKSEADMDVGGGAGKSHTSTRYDYKNVQPPPGVK